MNKFEDFSAFGIIVTLEDIEALAEIDDERFRFIEALREEEEDNHVDY